MRFSDYVNFVVYDNPISRLVTGNNKVPLPPVPIIEKTPLWKLAREAGPFARIGALMGATAVALGAYGAHRTYPKEDSEHLRTVFETANRYHFFHSLALLAVPMCKNPVTAGTLILSGTLMFSGSLYYYAFTGEHKLGRMAPIGGTILIIGWLSMVV